MSKFNSNQFDAILLVANTVDGVFVADIVDYPEMEDLGPKDFCDSLDQLEDGEEIFTLIMPKGTDGVYEDIDAEYGIR